VNSITSKTDFLIVGSGAAGLQAALHASQYGSVTLLTKSSLEASSSYWAQGGIAAVLNSTDSFQSHKNDTLEAGRGLCDEQAVDVLVEEGARCVEELIQLGMPFDRTGGTLDLGLEGGHSNRRVLHANGAATGKALVEFLAARVSTKQNIQIIEHAFVYELSTARNGCRGANAYLYEQDRFLSIQSRTTILATGGYSGLYQRSTNPHTSTGDGLWLGYNAGVELQDLEFVQFHPTAFYDEDGGTFLISEAVRGEGARLYNAEGDRFMADYAQQELSPRDIVSKEIFEQIQNSKADHVYLDLQHLDAEEVRSQFPALIGKVESHGVNIANEGIPVAPAAHYCIGGIATNLNGQTSVDGLYACGEVAATGVHGANRLASNSLLECLVFAKRAVEHAEATDRDLTVHSDAIDFQIDHNLEQQFTALQNQVSGLLSQHVGIVRDREGMTKVLHQLEELGQKLPQNTDEYFCLRSEGLLQVARMITESALQREESRGVHTRLDFPVARSAQDHTLRKADLGCAQT
jgi:L-aspartate oxidase